MISKHDATYVTPKLIYGQEVVMAVEINLQECRVARQSALSAIEYTELMMDRIDETLESQFRALG
jgi:hypothetical protein